MDKVYGSLEEEKSIDNSLQFMFFFNPGSGGERAQQLIALDQKSEKYTAQVAQTTYTVHFASMIREESRLKGIEKLKALLQSLSGQVKVVIGGGDGTIMWVIETLLAHKIDVMRCVIIPFPFGTGNDFSNCLGWGVSVPDDIIGPRNKTILKYLDNWTMHGQVMFFDIWEVDFTTLYIVIQHDKDRGSFQKVVKNVNSVMKMTVQDEKGGAKRQYIKKMSNYFSVGIDARVGLGFDRNRTGSQCCNKCVYCWEGFKKLFLKTRRINDVISGFQPYENMVYKYQLAELETIQSPLNGKGQQITLQSLEGDPVTLACFNINSYSGGVQDIWKNAQTPQTLTKLKLSNQTSFSDGMLEFVSFNHLMQIGIERFYSGNAQRVSQGPGPFVLNFKESNEDLITYFQVDGEYFQVTNPQRVTIRPCQDLPNGKVRVLVYND